MILDLAETAVLEPSQDGLLVLHDPARLDILFEALPVLGAAFVDEPLDDDALTDGRVASPLVPVVGQSLGRTRNDAAGRGPFGKDVGGQAFPGERRLPGDEFFERELDQGVRLGSADVTSGGRSLLPAVGAPRRQLFGLVARRSRRRTLAAIRRAATAGPSSRRILLFVNV